MRRRRSWAVAASVLAHLGVLVAVLLQHPTLVIPAQSSGPPEAIIPVLILPRTPPPAASGGARPAPIRLHQRLLRNLPSEAPMPPVVLPAPRPSDTPPQAAPSPAPAKAAQAPPPADAIRATLRTALGCNSADLSRDERARCQEQLGRGAHEEPFMAAPIAGDKRAAYDAAGAAKLAARAELERPIARPGPPLPNDYDGEPNVGGPIDGLVGPHARKPSKRAARVLPRLPP